MKEINEYKISDFPNFDMRSGMSFKYIKKDFPDLIADYIYDLEDGLNIKLHNEHKDENGYYYEEFNLNDLKYYCDLKNYDFELPEWINSLSVKVYLFDEDLDREIEMEGFVNLPIDTESDIHFNEDTKTLDISNFTLYTWKDKNHTKGTISHELTHCYDFYKRFVTNKGYYKNLADEEGNWKHNYDLSHEDNLSLYGNKSWDFQEDLKEEDPNNYNEYINSVYKILNNPEEWKNNENIFVFCLTICRILYYLDISEMKAFYMEQNKENKNLYSSIYNIVKFLPEVSSNFEYENNIFELFKEFIYDTLGIGFKGNFIDYLKEIQFELLDDAKDAYDLFNKNNKLNEVLLSWDINDINQEDSIIKVSTYNLKGGILSEEDRNLSLNKLMYKLWIHYIGLKCKFTTYFPKWNKNKQLVICGNDKCPDIELNYIKNAFIKLCPDINFKLKDTDNIKEWYIGITNKYFISFYILTKKHSFTIENVFGDTVMPYDWKAYTEMPYYFTKQIGNFDNPYDFAVKFEEIFFLDN